MSLYREIKAGVDISSEATVLTYTSTRLGPILVLPRVEAGDNSKPIAGSANYVLRAAINDVVLAPESRVLVGVEPTAIMQGRHVAMEPGDVLTISVVGTVADTDVNIVSTLYDMTPAQAADIVGRGTIVVDHDYGGADALSAMTLDNAGISDVTIYAYLASDYAAGNRGGSFIVAQTSTDVHGHWRQPMMLDPATYTLVYFKQGAYKSRTVSLVVE